MKMGHKKLFPIAIRKAREEIETLDTSSKREQEREQELADIKADQTLAAARAKTTTGNAENLEEQANTLPSLPQGKRWGFFLSHSKFNSALIWICRCILVPNYLM